MIKYNLLLIYRSFKRDKSSFLINLIGLASGLACALLIYLWVNDELNMDKFHKNDGKLYQVLTTHPSEAGIDTWRTAPVPLVEALKENMPELEYAVGSSPVLNDFTLSFGDLHFSASAKFADKDYFKIFSYDLSQGDRDKVLEDKNAIVISESTALKLFNTTENVLGKTISWQDLDKKREATVTGVFKDITTKSSVRFDFVISFEVFKELLGTNANWGNHHAEVFLLLKDGTDVKSLGRKIAEFFKTKSKESNATLVLQKYSDQYLYNKFENGVQAGGRIEYVRLFSLIAIFIVLIACINFMNLSTAKAFRKMKEVGIKKAIGAQRKALIYQYLGESMSVTILSFFVAVILVFLLLPQFNFITGKSLSLIPDRSLLLGFTVIALFTGILSGSYPALYLSGFNPAVILKGKLSNPAGELFTRKGLVVFQFALSVLLIVAVVVVYKQIEMIQTRNPGFNRENIVQFKIEGKVTENQEVFLSEIKNLPGVVNASSMWGSIIGETGITQGSFNWEGKDPNAVVAFSNLGVNYNMLELLGIGISEGRTFSSNFGDETSKIIINEAGISVMGLKNPVGKIFGLWGKNYEIIGVAKDFNFRSFHEKVKPFFFRLNSLEADKILVKIAAGKERETIDQLQALYKSFNPGFTFNYSFLDDEYQRQYLAEQRISVLSRYFAALAILISCLGLFGLATYTAERRVKEIGIRKVLGAGEFGIVQLLSTDFTRMIIIAIAIALPVSYLIVSRWLEGFAYSIDLKWWYFGGSGVITLLIAWFTIGIQTIKAAIRNPLEALRYE